MRQAQIRARVLASITGDEGLAELYARGSDFAVVELVLAQGLGRAMLVGPLSLEQAQALRQAAKTAGALAVLAKPAGRADPTRAEVVVMGGTAPLGATAAAIGGEVGAQMAATLAAFAAPPARAWRCRERMLTLGERTLVMGIVNVTPDSFSGDGLGTDVGAAIAQGLQLIADGADLLDIGGESTRPGSEPVPVEEELRRVVPVIEGLAKATRIPLSVDTYKSAVARAALEAGACIVNDISGFHLDPEMAEVVAASGAGVILMHMRGTPREMQREPKYNDVIGEIGEYLAACIARAEVAGIGRDQLVVDPGFGFGKTVEHNLEILRRLREFRALGCPVLIGASRKSTIGKVLDLPANQRLEGTAATVALAIAAGADIVRVHDVKEMARVAKMSDAIVRVKYDAPESEHQWEQIH